MKNLRQLLYVSLILALFVSCAFSQEDENPDENPDAAAETATAEVMGPQFTGRCSSQCRTCYGSNSISCLTCTSPRAYWYENTSCVENCPSRWWKDQSQLNNYQCRECHPSCRNCFGYTAYNCTDCASPNFFYNGDNTCRPTCPPGWWGDATNPNNRRCRQCNANCKTCSAGGANNCTSCNSPNYLDRNRCTATCPNGSYRNSDTNTCDRCNTACQNCNGGNSSTCLSCPNPNLWAPWGTCSVRCPPGTYSIANRQCAVCHSSCNVCTSATRCTSCKTPNYAYNGYCRRDCPSGYVKNDTSHACQRRPAP